MHRVSIGRIAHPFPFWTGFCAVLFALLLMSDNSASADESGDSDVVIRIQPGVNIKKIAAAYHTVPRHHVADTSIYSLVTPAGEDEANFIAQLQRDSRVVSAEADTIIQGAELDGDQLHFAFDAGNQPGAYLNQGAYQQIHLGSAQSISRGAGVNVAILDTGVLAKHTALHGHLLPGYNALDPNSPPDDVPDGTGNIAVGHGTMIAGVVARIAPDAKILPIRVLNGDGTGTLFSVIAGIHYAVKHGAQVINMSFGSVQSSDTLEQVVEEANQAGVVIVASAGNSDLITPHYPAALDHVLAVASVEANDVKSDYSNFGEYIGVVAPGTGIRSTYWTGGYANWSGTSFATPFVTATAALVYSAHPNYPAWKVIERIKRTAHSVDRLNPLYRELLGTGIIDVEQAVSARTEDE